MFTSSLARVLNDCAGLRLLWVRGTKAAALSLSGAGGYSCAAHRNPLVCANQDATNAFNSLK